MGGKQEDRAWRVIRLNSEPFWQKSIHDEIQFVATILSRSIPTYRSREAICSFSACILMHRAWNHFATDRHLLAQRNTDLVQSTLHVSWAAQTRQTHAMPHSWMKLHHDLWRKQYFFHGLRKRLFLSTVVTVCFYTVQTVSFYSNPILPAVNYALNKWCRRTILVSFLSGNWD